MFSYIKNVANAISTFIITNTITTVFFLFKCGYSLSKTFKRILNDDVKFKSVVKYAHLQKFSYVIINNNKTYNFSYLVRDDNYYKELTSSESKYNLIHNNEGILIDKLLNDTVDNIKSKENNKNKILHVSLVTDNDETLCDLTELLQELKYYFDLESTNPNVIYWKDIIHITEHKYNKKIDGNSTYVYFILNDSDLTEKTVLVSSILTDNISFE